MPSHRADENPWRTSTVGVSKVINLSSPPWDRPNAGACARSAERIAAGESQFSSLESRGSVVMSLLVCLWYDLKAVLNIIWKFEGAVGGEV
jgi:hypothetical protein